MGKILSLLAIVDLNSVEGKFKMNGAQKVEPSCVQPNGTTIFFFFFGQEINAKKKKEKNYFIHTIMYIIHTSFITRTP